MNSVKIPFCVNIAGMAYEDYCKLYDEILKIEGVDTHFDKYNRSVFNFSSTKVVSYLCVDEDSQLYHSPFRSLKEVGFMVYESPEEFYKALNRDSNQYSFGDKYVHEGEECVVIKHDAEKGTIEIIDKDGRKHVVYVNNKKPVKEQLLDLWKGTCLDCAYDELNSQVILDDVFSFVVAYKGKIDEIFKEGE